MNPTLTITNDGALLAAAVYEGIWLAMADAAENDELTWEAFAAVSARFDKAIESELTEIESGDKVFTFDGATVGFGQLLDRFMRGQIR